MNRTKWLAVALAGAITVLAPAAQGAVAVKGVSTSSYPDIRVSVVTSHAGSAAPRLTENGRPVQINDAQNLGRAKSVVIAIDHSQSMKGKPLANAVAAARAFIAAKPLADRVAVSAFATEQLFLTGFSTDGSDADGALRSIHVDPVQGTTLYDGIIAAASQLDQEPLPARVIIVVTDGNETRSDASLDQTIAAVRGVGASVYVVAIESPKFNPTRSSNSLRKPEARTEARLRAPLCPSSTPRSPLSCAGPGGSRTRLRLARATPQR